MPASEPSAGFRRVLVALDSSASESTILETAAGLAAAQACQLSGLFVEDQDLLRLADLPFAREVQLTKAMSRALVPEQLLRDLRAQAGLARAAMARQAAQHRISWSFEVTQGRSEEAILMAAASGDIIAMARGFGALERGRISQQLRLIAARAPGPLLLAGGARRARPGPVLLPYDASPAAEAMLEIALNLARAQRVALEFLLLGAAVDQQAVLEHRLRGTAGAQGLPILRFQKLRGEGGLLRRLGEAERGLLVLPADARIFRPGDVERIIELTRLPLILQTELPPSAG